MAILNYGIKFQEPIRYPDFDPKVLKPAFRKMGGEVAKISRKLVSSRAVSGAGGFPGRDSGLLRKSIKAKVSRSGFSVGIKNYDIPQFDKFYPAFVYYGHRAPYTDSGKQQGKKRIGRKVAPPRANWIVAAAEKYGQQRYMAEMQVIMARAIKPGVITGGLQ